MNTPTHVMPIQIRWADIDANRHLRHSAYYDYGAMARMDLLSKNGLTTDKLEDLQIGPILFREEAIFRREVKLEDTIMIETGLVKATRDYGRWSLRHQLLKADGTVAAIINIDAAWLDLIKRKLATPDAFLQSICEHFPKAENFEWTEPTRKPS